MRHKAHIQGVPSPKADLNGGKIRPAYYEDGDLNRIVRYCELDMVTTARIFLRMRGEAALPDNRIVRVGNEGASQG